MKRRKRNGAEREDGHPPGREARAALARLRRQSRFLAQYVVHGTILHATRAAKIGRATHDVWMRRSEDGTPADPAYAEAFAKAKEMATECLEREARRRAAEGVLKPVYQGGKLVGHVREYSDLLLIFLLKAQRPAVYRERVEHVGAGGGPVEHAVTFYLPANPRMQASLPPGADNGAGVEGSDGG